MTPPEVYINNEWHKVGDVVSLGLFKIKWKIVFIGFDACAVLHRGKRKKTIIGAVRNYPTEVIFGSQMYFL